MDRRASSMVMAHPTANDTWERTLTGLVKRRLERLAARLDWPNSTLLHGDVPAAVADLKQSSSARSSVTQVRAYYLRGWLRMLQGDPAAARPWIARAIGTARETGLPALRGASKTLHGIRARRVQMKQQVGTNPGG
jgi:hypothetical protein